MKILDKMKFHKWNLKQEFFLKKNQKLNLNSNTNEKNAASFLCGHVFIFEETLSNKQEIESFVKNIIEELAIDWQRKSVNSYAKDNYYFQSQTGPVWILKYSQKKSSHQNLFSESPYTWARESVGLLYNHFKISNLNKFFLYWHSCGEELYLGSLVGLKMARYNFKNVDVQNTCEYYLYPYNELVIEESEVRGNSINLCRHLVNLPPNQLGPDEFKKISKSLSYGSKIKIEIWNKERLKKENMNLLLAVGQGAVEEPCMIHLSIKGQSKNKNSNKSYAFVGKGVTFDTGGLDIKPSSAMRLMKKDMGGAATVLALAYYASFHKWDFDLDFYIPLAENSVDGKSFRPSDLIQSRAGYWIEIDNTDAEGRLILADALDCATKEKKNLDTVINVATLTGAIKVALGAEVAGLFTNDDQLSEDLLTSAQKSGDLCWRMPLVEKYFSSLSSSFADFKNSAEGFGGAITAGLFLQKFINNKKWAHLDIYSWNDKPTGSLSFSGGSGQGVQLLIEYLNQKD